MAPDSILAFKNTWPNAQGQVHKDSTLVEFLMTIVKKLAATVDTTASQTLLQYTVDCPAINLEGLDVWLSTMSSIESRKQLVKRGEEFGQTFLVKL
jgi:urease accessory protein UreF